MRIPRPSPPFGGGSAALCTSEPLREPPDCLRIAAAAGMRPVFYWENPAEGFSLAGVGAALEIRASGNRRFETASRDARRALASIEAVEGARPLLVGGFGFADDDSAEPEWRELPALRWFVPRLLWVNDGGRAWLTRTAPPGEDDALGRLAASILARSRPVSPEDLSPEGLVDADDGEAFERRVEAIGRGIAAGDVRKVVIARRCRIRAPQAPSAAGLLARLRAERPTCFSFWFGAGETDFVGSSPERLLRLRAGTAVSEALAGTAPRGATPEEDRRLGIALVESEKNRREHEIVVAALRETLHAVGTGVEAPAEPELVLLPEAQHLSTSVRARLRMAASALDLAGRLHPTPAVCGVPRDVARSIIERDEPGRGWYCGGVGWTGGSGEGEIAVALRSALIDGRDVWLRAGAGIVEGSDPASERAETEVKLDAFLAGRRRAGRAA